MVIIVMGPMGCGKTTIGRMLAEELTRVEGRAWLFCDADDFHSPENVERMRAGRALTDEDREPWLKALRGRIESCLQSGQSAVLACSALKGKYRQILGVDQALVKTVYLKGTYEVVLERITGREHPYMNRALLASQFEAFEEPDDGIAVDIRATPESIVDMIVKRLRPRGQAK